MAVKRLLAATDLSARSERAIGRAAMLARQFQAEVILLHVVDADQPAALVEAEQRQADALLRAGVAAMPECKGLDPEILVRAGAPFQAVVQAAQEHAVDLVVVGAHRKAILRDVFVGTTAERIMRTGRQPVLMVNRQPATPYRRAVLASDTSEASARALQTAAALDYLEATDLSVVHGYLPVAKDVMGHAGIDPKEIDEHVARAGKDARNALVAFLTGCCAGLLSKRLVVEEGPPFEVIRRAVERLDAELVVIGTRGHTGLKRLLLGSVADEVLRNIECDVLAIPPQAGQGGR